MKRPRSSDAHRPFEQEVGSSCCMEEEAVAGFQFYLCGVSVTLTPQHFRPVRFLNRRADAAGSLFKDTSDAPASYLADGETAAAAPSIALNVDVVFRAACLSGVRVLVLRCGSDDSHNTPIALLPDPRTRHVTIDRGLSYELGAFVGGTFHRLERQPPPGGGGGEFVVRLGRALDGFLRFIDHPTTYANLHTPMDLLRKRVAGALHRQRKELEGQGIVHAASQLQPIVASWLALRDKERAQYLGDDNCAADADVHHGMVAKPNATRRAQRRDQQQ